MAIRGRARGCVVVCTLLITGLALADTRMEQETRAVDAAFDSAYMQALANFDLDMGESAGDAALAVNRCEFIQQFTDSEGGRYLERAEADLDECNGKLKSLESFPEVQVYDFENDWDDGATQRGEALLAKSAGWPLPLRKKLVADLASRYRYKPGNDDGRKKVIIQAAELGDDASMSEAVAALIEVGEAERAQALLDHAPPARSDWFASKRVRAALDLPDKQAARNELLRQQKANRQVAPAVAALAQLRAGDVQASKAALGDAHGTDEESLDARFRVAMAMQDYPAAASCVRLQDWSDFAENTGRFLTLVAASPLSLMRPALWASVAILAACVLFYLLLPGVLLVPVHYRGLARRVSGRIATPLFEAVRMRHAWAAIAMFLLVPLCVLAAVDPGHFGAIFADGGKPGPGLMLRAITLADALCLLLFAPMVLRFARAGKFHPAAALGAWKRVLLAIGISLAVGMALGVLQRLMGVDTMTDQVRMVNDLINSPRTRAGGIFALFVVALLVPLWEEFSFRGMVLGGMSRHIGFGWANLWQALLFALCHNDWPRFPYYVTVGLLAGWLVKRTGKLAPSIFMHMIINATAFLLLRA